MTSVGSIIALVAVAFLFGFMIGCSLIFTLVRKRSGPLTRWERYMFVCGWSDSRLGVVTITDYERDPVYRAGWYANRGWPEDLAKIAGEREVHP